MQIEEPREKPLLYWKFIYNESYTKLPETEPGPLWWEAESNRLSYSTAYSLDSLHIIIIILQEEYYR